MRVRALLIPLLLVGLALSACGQQQAAPPPAAPTAAPTEEPAAGTLEAIPQSRSAEGYQILGAPDAPVTLVMYSDFF